MIYLNLFILAINVYMFVKYNNIKKYIRPTEDGKGIIIYNRHGKPVVKFDKPLI